MRSFCIIGLGEFGTTLARTLAEERYQVMVIDRDPEAVEAVSDVVVNAVVGDPTSDKLLAASGVRNYDCAVVCCADSIDDSVLITLLLKEMGVAQVVSRAGSELHRRVLEKVGADRVVFPEKDMGERIAHILMKESVLEYFEFSDQYTILELMVPTEWVGRTIAGIDVRRKYGVTVIAVQRINGETIVSPGPELRFASGDKASVIGKGDDLDRLTKRMD